MKLSRDYIAGLIDGEGCFAIGFQRLYPNTRRVKWKRRYTMKKPQLSVGVKVFFRLGVANKDKKFKVLYGLKKYFGVGEVYLNKRDLSKYTSQMQYATSTVRDAIIIRKKIAKMPLVIKRNDFRYWCKAIDLMSKRKHLTKKGILELAFIRSQMNYRMNRQGRSLKQIKVLLDMSDKSIRSKQD